MQIGSVDKGRRIAAALLEVAEADVDFVQRRLEVNGTDRSVGLFEAAVAALGDSVPSELREPRIEIYDQRPSIQANRSVSALGSVNRRLRSSFLRRDGKLPLLKAVKGAILARNCRNLANVGSNAAAAVPFRNARLRKGCFLEIVPS